MPARRPYKPTLKQVLVRDYNWRMGNLRRLMINCQVLDTDLTRRAEWCVEVQMAREKAAHERRLTDLKEGRQPIIKDWIWERALIECSRAT